MSENTDARLSRGFVNIASMSGVMIDGDHGGPGWSVTIARDGHLVLAGGADLPPATVIRALPDGGLRIEGPQYDERQAQRTRIVLSCHDDVLNALIAEAEPLGVDIQDLVVKAYAAAQKTRNIADYEQGYRDGESSRSADVRILVEESASLEELLTHLRRITGYPELEWGWDIG